MKRVLRRASYERVRRMRTQLESIRDQKQFAIVLARVRAMEEYLKRQGGAYG